jgi:hypothetical protein
VTWRFYVYTLSILRGGVPVVFYVGGAYGNANRMNVHGAERGSLHVQKFLRMNPGSEIVREIYAYCANKRVVAALEPRAWDEFKALGHPVQEERPGSFSEKINAAFAAAGWPHLKRNSNKQSAETRSRRSASLTGRKMRPESVAKASEARRGQKRSPEARERMAAAKRGKKQPNISAALTGRSRPDISARLRGHALSTEHRANISAALLKTDRHGRPFYGNQWTTDDMRYSGRGTLIARRSDAFPIRVSR